MDIVQNAVCKALEKCSTLRNENAMKTWFYRILVNESLLLLKERKRLLLTDDEKSNDPGYEEQGFELQDDLHEKIGQLETATQTIIRLRFFEELSLEEISAIMGINLSTVKSKLYRGLKQLKVMVEEDE